MSGNSLTSRLKTLKLLPAGHTNIEILSNVEKTPLFIDSDIAIGETSLYADYIFPDLSYMERWEFHGSHPSVTPKVQPSALWLGSIIIGVSVRIMNGCRHQARPLFTSR